MFYFTMCKGVGDNNYMPVEVEVLYLNVPLNFPAQIFVHIFGNFLCLYHGSNYRIGARDNVAASKYSVHRGLKRLRVNGDCPVRI